MKRIRLLIAATAVLTAASGMMGATLMSAPPASAQASCTGATLYVNAKGIHVWIPTIGDETSADNCELGVGNDSSAVYWLQYSLNTCYGAGLALDGDYGPLTEAAVRHAQGLAGIPQDGIYGPVTRQHIKWSDSGSADCAVL
jgi:peptidoglycan hydrolase-like protein with peptidoglycan-binding domain